RRARATRSSPSRQSRRAIPVDQNRSHGYHEAERPRLRRGGVGRPLSFTKNPTRFFPSIGKELRPPHAVRGRRRREDVTQRTRPGSPEPLIRWPCVKGSFRIVLDSTL